MIVLLSESMKPIISLNQHFSIFEINSSLLILMFFHWFFYLQLLRCGGSGCAPRLSFPRAALDGLDLEHDTLPVKKVIGVLRRHPGVIIIVVAFFTAGWPLALRLEEVLAGDLGGLCCCCWCHYLLRYYLILQFLLFDHKELLDTRCIWTKWNYLLFAGAFVKLIFRTRSAINL